MKTQVAFSLACLLLCSCRASGKTKLEVCSMSLPEDRRSPQVVYYRTGRDDSDLRMHYAWSNTGAPAFFVSMSNDSRPCNESISYNKTFHDDQTYNSVRIPSDGADSFKFAVIFTRVIEFPVRHYSTGFDPARLFNSSMNYTTTSYWLNDETLFNKVLSGNTLSMTLNSSNSNSSAPNALTIKFTIPENEGKTRLSGFPKSLYTDTSALFDLTLDFQGSPKRRAYDNSRAAIEMMVIHGPSVQNGSVRHTTSFDDEYTPSVFTTVNYVFDGQMNTSTGPGFMQWKPISYQSSARKSTVSQQANVVTATGNATNITEIPGSLASALFENDPAVWSNAERLYMVFGTPGDDTYVPPSYMTWTAVVGQGDPPKESVSIVVIITISLGLGIPVLLVIAGGVYVVLRKKPWENVMRWSGSLQRKRDYNVIRVNE